MSCCQCQGIEHQFDHAAVARKLRRYRRRGPDTTTRLLIQDLRAALATSNVRDATLLDVGGGLGAIHHALLDERVSRAVHVDASSAQIAAARDETERLGHGTRVEFVRGDFTRLAPQLAAADIVTLDRVICCFDDMHALVGLSAAKAARFYGAVYPRDGVWMRVGIRAVNLFERIKRSSFRVFLHDPRAIDAELRAAGLARSSVRTAFGWEVVVYRR
jgi:magnesium-protoporphyrin O-methyltransferase